MAAVLLGCSSAVAVPVMYAGHSSGPAPVRAFGAGAPTRLAAQAPAAATQVPSRTATSSPRATSYSRRPAASATVATSVPTVPTSAPAALVISGTGISAPVVPVGVDAYGAIAIPERVDTVGWYRFGPRPGTGAGSIVLVGHVDSAEQGEGAFFRLRSVRPGAIVTITGTDHRLYPYRVVGRQEYPKTVLPLGALFTRTGAPHLTLITCGGSFDAATRSYRDNVVVTAIPIPGAR